MTFYLFSYTSPYDRDPKPHYHVFDSDGNCLKDYALSIPEVPNLFATCHWEPDINAQALQFFGSVPACISHTNGNLLVYLGFFSTLADLTTLFPEHFL